MGEAALATGLVAAAGALASASEGARYGWQAAAAAVLGALAAAVVVKWLRTCPSPAWGALAVGPVAVAAASAGAWCWSERGSTTQLAGLVLVAGGAALARVA